MAQITEAKIEKAEELEIDLGELLQTVWENIGKILIATLIGGIIALAYTMFLVTPTYRSTFTAFVNNRAEQGGQEAVASGDVTAARGLTYTYASIMKSRPILEDALNRTGLTEKYTYSALRSAVSTSIEENTQLVNYNVQLESPEDAYQIAKAISEAAPYYMAEIVEGSSMKIVANPVLPTSWATPNVKRNLLLGLVIGALAMLAFVVIRDLLDTRIKSEQELEQRFGVPVVGTIPNFEAAAHGDGSRYYSHYQKKGGK